MAPGLSAEHANPTGLVRRVSLSSAGPFAGHFTVYLVNRKAGLAPGSTMSDIAGDYAKAIEDGIGEPVALHGTSTVWDSITRSGLDGGGLLGWDHR
jgi:hypothetical protein